MGAHSTFAAAVVSCMDGRFRKAIDAFLEERFGNELVDRIFVPGASLALTFSFPNPEQSNLFDGIRLAYEKHGIRRLLIIEHEDCGKYASSGLVRNPEDDRETHARRSRVAEAFLKRSFPELRIERYFATIGGTIEPLA